MSGLLVCTELAELHGKTVRLATYDIDGTGIVLAFDDGSWCAIERSGEDGVRMHPYGTADILHYADPDDLLRTGLINRAQRDVIRESQKRETEERSRRYAESLMREAQAILEKVQP